MKMKKILSGFFLRGMIACGFGPIVFAILYLILQQQGVVKVITVNQMCLGIFSLAFLAFMAGGMNIIYQIERLPLIVAILIHGCVLYVVYLGTYLINDWMESGVAPILVFTVIFVFGYLIIWLVIYSMNTRNTKRLNQILIEKQSNKG